MKIDAGLLASDMGQVAARARELEGAGFDGCFTFEGPHEPFMRLLLAAEHSDLEIGTGLAVAFARTPMTVAHLAHDLQHFSGGRFWLGLGSQIRPHIAAPATSRSSSRDRASIPGSPRGLPFSASAHPAI